MATRTDRSSGRQAADKAVTDNLSGPIRQELERAIDETKRQLVKPGKGPAMLVGSGFAGYMTLLFVSIAVWWGLSNVMDQGWAALIVATVWAVVCAVLYVAGKRRMRGSHSRPAGRRRGRKSEQTVETAWGREPVT